MTTSFYSLAFECFFRQPPHHSGVTPNPNGPVPKLHQETTFPVIHLSTNGPHHLRTLVVIISQASGTRNFCTSEQQLVTWDALLTTVPAFRSWRGHGRFIARENSWFLKMIPHYHMILIRSDNSFLCTTKSYHPTTIDIITTNFAVCNNADLLKRETLIWPAEFLKT